MFAMVMPFILGIIAAFIMVCITWSSRHTRTGRYFIQFTVIMLWWSVFYTLELISTNKTSALFCANVQFLAIGLLPGCWFLLVRAHLGMPSLSGRNKLLLLLPGIITATLAVTDPWLGLMRDHPGFLKVASGAWVVDANYSWWHDYIFLPYLYILIFLSSVTLLVRLFSLPSYYRLPTFALAMVPVPVCIAGVVYHLGYSPIPHVNYAVAVFSVMSVPVCWGIYTKNWLMLAPQARDLVISSMQDGVVVVDNELAVIDYNHAAEMLLDIELEQKIGHSITEIIPHVDQTRQELQIGHRMLQYTEHIIRDRTGESLGKLYILSDISSEIQLRRLLARAVQTLPIPTVVLQDGQVVEYSSTMVSCFGYRFEQFTDFYAWARRVMPEWRYDIHSLPGEAAGVFDIICEDHTEKRVQVASADLGDMVTWTLTDITERHLADLKLKDALADLEHTNRELQSFAYVISHDLKAPLRAITNISQWVQEDYADKLDDNGKEQLALLAERAKKLSSMVDGVLRYSRMASRDYVIELIDTEALVKSVVSVLAPPSSMTIIITHLPKLYGDTIRLEQIFQNLLSNAIKFVNRQDGVVEISYDYENQCFSVKDNGPGIPAGDRERVFTLFAVGANRAEDSTGVGLALVKRIVEMYGGHIWLELPEGGGCDFRFTLPKCLRKPSTDKAKTVTQ